MRHVNVPNGTIYANYGEKKTNCEHFVNESREHRLNVIMETAGVIKWIMWLKQK